MKRQKWPVSDAAIRRAIRTETLETSQARGIVRKGDTLQPRDMGYVPPPGDTDEGGGDGGGGGGTTVMPFCFKAAHSAAGETEVSAGAETIPLTLTYFGDSSLLDGSNHITIPYDGVYELAISVRFHASSPDDVSDQVKVQIQIGDSGTQYPACYVAYDGSGSFHTAFNSQLVRLGTNLSNNRIGPLQLISEGEKNYLVNGGGTFNGTYVQLNLVDDFSGSGGGGDGAPADPITFFADPPFNLTEEDGEYFMDWKCSDEHYGYTKAQAEQLVGSFLDDSRGWRRVGITPRHTEEALVEFKVVLEATCDSPELACTHYDEPGLNAFVELEYPHLRHAVYPTIGPGNLINHEAGHAYFGAEHSGGGIMSDFDANRPEWPTTSDVRSVRDWLGL